LLAAYLTLLHRHTGQRDLIVGSPTSGRTDRRFQSLVGYLVNLVPIRVNLEGALRFRQFLTQVRENVLAAFEHQEYPFPLLVNSICPDRDPSRSPVFQTTFVFEKVPSFSDPALAAFVLGEEGARLEIGSLALESVRNDQEVAQFDLSMVVAPIDGGVTVALQYNKALFKVSTIKRMLCHFSMLVDEITARPDQRIGEISILTERERRQVVVEFNETREEYGAGGCVSELFEAQVEKTPGAIGVVYEGGSVSYGELNRRANQLAEHLRRLGVGGETRVGILMERSVEMIISLLGVLKAGGTYVPLDPAYPSERLSFMMEDSGAAVLISKQGLAERLAGRRVQVVSLDEQGELIAQARGENPEPLVGPENLSHIIYTSGSTGRPKGVGIAHGSVVNFLHWAHETFGAEELSGVLAATSICFDLSVFEIFVPLTCGGAVILADDALHLASHREAARVTLINTVPSAMAELLRLKAVGAGVLTVNLAGEALQNKLVQQLYEETNVGRVLNLYGPTEYTTYTTGQAVAKGSQRQPSIGRSIANTQVYIVDEESKAVPIGVVGEVCIGGRGLARGYWKRPALTAERFVADNLSGEAGARLYRTGDLGRYLENGEIEYLGRKDHQVKIRGYRIELGEIEAVLAAHPGVDAAAVVAKEDASGHKYLAGYVSGDGLSSTGELRTYLQSSLPNYMVPSTLMWLEQLYLTPNGKIDRKSLPQPVREDNSHQYVAPQTRAEKILAAIWEQVLGVERVGISDNFFDLGGDSILSIHVVTSARRAGLGLTPRQVFQEQTLAKLALAAQETASPQVQERASDLQVSSADRSLHTSDFLAASLSQEDIEGLLAGTDLGSLEDIYPLTPFQQGMLFHVLDAPDAGIYLNQQRYTLRGELDYAALQNAFQAVLDRHQILRTAFLLSAPGGALQVVYRRLNLPWAVYDWRELELAEKSERLDALLRADYQRGFDLAQAPLMRVALVRMEPDVFEFIWSFHLMLMDGWSVPIIFKELLAFYHGFRAAEPVELEQPIRYRDYVDWLQGQSQDQAETYWRQSLAGFAHPTSLGFDRVPLTGEAELGGYGEKSLLVDHATTTALRDFAGRHKLTLNTLMQGAWALLLSRRSGDDDVVFGSVVSGRAADFPGVESAVGVFVNALPVRVRMPQESPLASWLEDLQTQQAEARRFEFSSLVTIQGWSEVPRGQPLFDSVLIFQNIPRDINLSESEGLRVVGIRSTERSNLPLALVVEPGSQLLLNIVYQHSRLDEVTIGRILETLHRILIQMANDSQATLSVLSTHAQAERSLLINSFNQSLTGF